MEVIESRVVRGRKEGKMMVGQAYREWLTPREQKALDTGCYLLIDFFFEDCATFEDWEPERVAETMLGIHLPSRYLSHYTPEFFKKFVVCLITVSWKLAQPKHLPLASVGEELAAWAIINQAKSLLEMEYDKGALLAAENVPAKSVLEHVHADADEPTAGEDFERFIESYFEDLDFLFLFDDAYDGIDASSAGTVTGMASLAFQNWFRPFSEEPERIAHPYTIDE